MAVKVLLERYGAASKAADRFIEEARITGQLQHPAIPPVHQVGKLPDGRPFLAMKLIQGRTLDHLLAERQTPEEGRGRFLAIFEQMCQAVAYAHSRNVIHRDLKPSNVMVGAFGEVQVMDWGLAKELSQSQDTQPSPADCRSEAATDEDADETAVYQSQQPVDAHTQAGDVLGTPAYMPPEQARGDIAHIDQRADVFSLGGILCALLTGDGPYAAPSGFEVLKQAAAGDLDEAMSRLNACGADPDLVALCQRCLAPNPDDRPRDAGEVAESVAAHLAAAEDRARQAELDRVRAAEQRKRRRVQRTLAAAVAGLVVVVGVGIALASLWREAESARDQLSVQQQATEAARVDAVRLKGLAEQAQEEVERQRAKLAVVEYGRSMELAHQEWRDNNVPTASTLVDGAEPKLRGWEWRYLHRLCHLELLTLQGHTSRVTFASFSPDGRRIVTASWDKTAKVWDAVTGAELLTLKGHSGYLHSASFSPDGARIVTASEDKTAKVWDAETGAELLTLKGHTGMLTSASFSPDGGRIVTASYDKTAKVWDAKNGSELRTLTAHEECVYSASFSPDGGRIVTAGQDDTAKVWDANTGAELLTLDGHTNFVLFASFSPDGGRIVTASGDKTAKVWDAETGAELLTLASDTRAIMKSASFSPDGERIVTARGDKTAKVWDAETGAELLTFKGNASYMHFASFSPDGTRIVTASADNTAKVWDARTGAEPLTLTGHKEPVHSASFSPDGGRIVTASRDKSAKVWDAETGAELLTLKGHDEPC